MKSHDNSLILPSIAVANLWRRSVEVVDADVAGLENNLTAGCEPRRDQILDDFVLGVDGNRAASGQTAQIDAMAATAKAQLDTVMGQTEALEPLADTSFNQQVDGALLEQAGANPLFDILAAASLEHDGLDSGEVQQVGEHQASGARADDADLCAMIHPSALRFRKFIALLVVINVHGVSVTRRARPR